MEDFEIKDGILLNYHGTEKNIVLPETVTHIDSDAFSSDLESIQVYGIEINLESILSKRLYEYRYIFPDEEDYLWQQCEDRGIEGDRQAWNDIRWEWQEAYEEILSELKSDILEDVIEALNLLFTRNFDELENETTHVYHFFDDHNNLTAYRIDTEIVRDIAVQMFLRYPEDEKIIAYINNHFIEFIKSLYHSDQASMQKLIDSGKFCPADTKLISSQGLVIFNSILLEFNGKSKEIIIPDTVTIIGDKAFSGCKRITKITIPETVTCIENMAFFNCQKITGIHIPESVTDIAENAFLDCKKLTEMTFFYDDHKFEIHTQKAINFIDVMKLLKNKAYTDSMAKDLKYSILFQMFTTGMDSENLTAYIKKNFTKMFRFLIDTENTATIQKVLDTDIFVTKKNIDNYIKYAIDNQKHQAPMILTDYKAQKNWYDTMEKKLNL